MNLIDKLKLFILTAITDISLIYIYVYLTFSIYEQLWLLLTFIVHINFYVGIIYNFRKLLDFLHIFVFLLPFLTLFLQNWYIKFVALLFVLAIQMLWIKEERCILNEINDDKSYGYGKIINVVTLFLGTILSYQLGILHVFVNI